MLWGKDVGGRDLLLSPNQNSMRRAQNVGNRLPKNYCMTTRQSMAYYWTAVTQFKLHYHDANTILPTIYHNMIV